MPAAEIFIHGHGSWKPANGYFQMPKNCSVSFYTHFAKLLNATMAYPILENAYSGEADRTIGQFMQVPNMQLSSLTQTQQNSADDLFAKGGGRNLYTLPPAPPVVRISLEKIVDMHVAALERSGKRNVELRFHWIACQQLGLKSKGGGEAGVNASDRSNQSGHKGQYLFKWRDDNGVLQERFVASESTFNKVAKSPAG
ncbi:MAG: hypothetical protein KDE08_06645 [Rhodobacteraceae bacterium]|nr:hypothetical protein [Paracoccaceae bacterium]